MSVNLFRSYQSNRAGKTNTIGNAGAKIEWHYNFAFIMGASCRVNFNETNLIIRREKINTLYCWFRFKICLR